MQRGRTTFSRHDGTVVCKNRSAAETFDVQIEEDVGNVVSEERASLRSQFYCLFRPLEKRLLTFYDVFLTWVPLSFINKPRQ